MKLSPEQNAAWCRKCIDLINGDDEMPNTKSVFEEMPHTTIETMYGGLKVSQEDETGLSCVFIPGRYIDLFLAELNRVAKSA